MSTTYRLLKEVAASDLFDGQLEEYGVREHFSSKAKERHRLLTDGRNYLWVSINYAGFVSDLTRYAPNGAPGKILTAIADTFDTQVVSEHEPQFWGCDTEEELDAFWEKIAREDEDKFYDELLKYLRGEQNDIQPGTIGMLEAEIGKQLVEKDPALLLPANKDKLLNEMRSIYDRDHAVIVELSPQEVAAAKMMGTHEDDLPS